MSQESESKKEQEREARIQDAVRWWETEQRKLAAERDKRFPDNKILNGALCLLMADGSLVVFQDSYNVGVLYAMKLALQDAIDKMAMVRSREVSQAQEEVTLGIDPSKLN